MYVSGGTLDLVGCKFLGNSATIRDGDIRNWGTVNIDGCPAGFFGAAGAALDTYGISGEAKSYSCAACVR